jgi:hypothetical protein
MDSWSRPSANSKIPPPLYLSGQDVPYCQTCGRAMLSKRPAKAQNNTVKYCSDRCRSRKPGPLDRRIEKTIVALLNGEDDSGVEKTAALSRRVKGDPRNVVTCDEIEEIIFGSRFDPEKVYGRRKNRKSRAIGLDKEWKSVDMEDDEPEAKFQHDNPDTIDSMHIRPPQDQADVNFSIGGERSRGEKIEASAEDVEKRREGDRRAEEREMVRRAARRLIVFGSAADAQAGDQSTIAESGSKASRKTKSSKSTESPASEATHVRKAEALMNGTVVEPSFAKGNWSIRWRE